MSETDRDLRLLVFPCPECRRPSDSIKAYTLGTILFLLVGAVSWRRREVGCPSCIRGKIALFAAVNLVTANLLWPILILPWATVQLLRSFTRGHSKAVLDALRAN